MDWETILGVALFSWFLVLAAAELVLSRGFTSNGRGDRRIITNLGLTAASLLTGSLLPVAAVITAFSDQQLAIGLAQHVAMPWVAVLILTVLLQSLAYYWLHRMMHAVPLAWRLHRVHHADPALDVSTSLRNHPLELLITVPTSVLVILAVGAPVSVAIAANSIFTAAVILQHADIPLPARIERVLGTVIMTPDRHRVHHSIERRLHDSNYGNLITIWDRWFGTLSPAERIDRVGLEDQPRPGDDLFEQIRSPLYSR